MTASSPAHWKNGMRMILVRASSRWGRGAPTKTAAPAEARRQAGRLMRRSRMQTCVIAAFGAALALVSPSLSVAAGALAIDENQGDQWGWAVGYSTQAGADRKAMEECGHGCRIVKRFSNSCAAYAADQSRGSTAYGWASGFSSTSAAQSRSLQECRHRGGAGSNCIVRAWGCDQPQARSASPGSQQPRKAGGPPRSMVRQAQELLSRLGYRPGPVDGIAGRRTTAAVERFQSASGMAVDGRIGVALVAKLQAAVDAGMGTATQPRPEKAQAAPKEAPAAAPSSKAGDLWGSIAFSQESGGGYAWAIVWNSAGHEAATRQALEVCRREGGGNCHEAGWFRNSCGALALGDGNGYGVDGGSTTGEAERAALAACRKVNRECRVEVSRCSSQGLETAGVEEPPEPPGPVEGERFRDCSGCPELIVVPSGSYEMGSPSSEEGRHDNEGPVHRVTISKPFAVGVYEVTFADWDACVSGGGCNGPRPDDGGWGRGNRPVIDVSWDDAKEYVGWLSRKTGEGYRLLSESEWEYVARAGTRTAYHFGSSISPGDANYDGNVGKTTPVGSYPANDFGLHDVHGNVWEWVEDCWHGSYGGAPSDGSAWVTGGECGRRVLRGGSWGDEPRYLRSAPRGGIGTGARSNGVGFRVARTLD